MAKKKEEQAKQPFEKRGDIKKLVVYVTIVNYGQGDAVLRLFKNSGTSAQISQLGHGTAGKSMREVLGIVDDRKEIIFSMVKEESVPELKQEIEAFFLASKKNRGIAFTIPLTSLVGIKLYHFFTNTI
ncbi:MAG: hypothetical protein MJ239_04535 [Bacilli bacterium]|nr:hypothetical protein [Bacilli bacterium]